MFVKMCCCIHTSAGQRIVIIVESSELDMTDRVRHCEIRTIVVVVTA